MILNRVKCFLTVLLFCCVLSISFGQKSNINNPKKERLQLSQEVKKKHRMVSAKLLVELDKQEELATNNNNSRQPPPHSYCCPCPCPSAPMNYDVIVFDLSANWVLFDGQAGDIPIPSPIPYFESLSHRWEVTLYNNNKAGFRSKSVFVQNNELILSIADLEEGSYFIELEAEGEFYATSFTIGPGTQTPPTSTTQSQKN